jgi:ubiquinone/menaquinone biosynthesis C-methylase UbiE
MIPRILEPEVMDTREEAVDYDAMDHSEVNRAFVDDLLAARVRVRPTSAVGDSGIRVLDVGTGTALIPIELCGRSGDWRIVAVDLSAEMIKLGAKNVAAAGLQDRIDAQHLDAKRLPFESGRFDLVMSNSIIHHIPRPIDALAEMVRVAGPSGDLFIRDLLRPDDVAELDRLVSTYAGSANDHQRDMFRASLHAALTLVEMRELAREVGLSPGCVTQTSDRHWTLSRLVPDGG